ncbi:MAG: Appr-1-p processing protein [Ignavibacteria bacterium]|nr:Appr-1-p processing protein [Ignavibacteria bacterium]
MIKVLIGDLFTSKMQTLVNTVNCVGVMGKGLALEFKRRFPDMFAEYVQRSRHGDIRLGKPYLFKGLLPPWILLFPTKDHWRSVSNLDAIEEGLEYLESKYREWGIESLAVPPLGCGFGELEWSIVGPTLYRHLTKLNIPIELYAPFGTPHSDLTPEFLEKQSEAQLVEMQRRNGSRIDPGLIATIEVLRRLENMPYHWPVGRIIFQKIAYFATSLELSTGLEYVRASFGPYSRELKTKLTKLVNNGLIAEERGLNMFLVRVGKTFQDARKVHEKELEAAEGAIERLTDLFCRMNTKQAELAATVHFARQTMKTAEGYIPTEKEVLDEVMRWKKRHRPPYDETEVAKTIRYLAIHRWLDVKPSTEITEELEVELEV